MMNDELAEASPTAAGASSGRSSLIAHHLLAVRNHLVNQPVFLRLLGAHNAVALDIALDVFNRLTAVLGQYLAGERAHAHDLFGVYANVGRLTGKPADGRLVNQDA